MLGSPLLFALAVLAAGEPASDTPAPASMPAEPPVMAPLAPPPTTPTTSTTPAAAGPPPPAAEDPTSAGPYPPPPPPSASPPPAAPDPRRSPPSPPPPTGVGFITQGAILTAGGLYFGGLSVIALGVNDDLSATDRAYLWPLAIGGAVATIGGGTLLGFGIKRNVAYRRWAQAHRLRPPRDGSALINAGPYVIALGLASLGYGIGSAVLASRDGADDGTSPYSTLDAVLGVSLGLGAIGGGTTMVVLGSRKRKTYQRWSRGGTVILRPVLAPPPTGRGATVGMVGRF